MIIQCEL